MLPPAAPADHDAVTRDAAPSPDLAALGAQRRQLESLERAAFTALLTPLGLVLEQCVAGPEGRWMLTVRVADAASAGACETLVAPSRSGAASMLAAAVPPAVPPAGAVPAPLAPEPPMPPMPSALSPAAFAPAPAALPALGILPAAPPLPAGATALAAPRLPATVTPSPVTPPMALPALPAPVPASPVPGMALPIADGVAFDTLEGQHGEALRVAPPATGRRNPFLDASSAPEDRAVRLARTLVSDMIAYSPDGHRAALAEGQEAMHRTFDTQISAARELYHREVDGASVPNRDEVFRQALNDLLANGARWF